MLYCIIFSVFNFDELQFRSVVSDIIVVCFLWIGNQWFPFSKLLLYNITDVGMLSRKTATSVSPVAVLTRDADGSYTLTFTTMFKVVTLTFKLGEEFIEERADGVKVGIITFIK